jgi:hypothetical protein
VGQAISAKVNIDNVHRSGGAFPATGSFAALTC